MQSIQRVFIKTLWGLHSQKNANITSLYINNELVFIETRTFVSFGDTCTRQRVCNDQSVARMIFRSQVCPPSFVNSDTVNPCATNMQAVKTVAEIIVNCVTCAEYLSRVKLYESSLFKRYITDSFEFYALLIVSNISRSIWR